MVTVRLNGGGALREFTAVPYENAAEMKDPVTPDAVFRAAALDMTAFNETPPTDAPPHASDQVRAWKGQHPKLPNTPLAIHMAWWKGRLTWMAVVFPNQKDPVTPKSDPALRKLIDAYPMVLLAVGLIGAAILARRNWMLNRVDRKGALWVGLASFAMFFVGWIGDVHAIPTPDMAVVFYRAASNWLMYATMVALVYLALEPSVRARWPHSLVTWNRLLAGQWRDPQVASHFLIGSAIGCVVWLLFKFVSVWTSGVNGVDFLGNLWFTMGTRQWLGGYAYILANALRVGLFGFLVICGLRALLRNVVAASIVASVIFTFTEGGVVNSPNWQIRVVIYLAAYSIIAFVLLRFGLVAAISVIFFVNGIGSLNLGLDWKTWFAPSGLASLLLLLTISLWAFWRSLGARGLAAAETG